jgi:hypothetical protein
MIDYGTYRKLHPDALGFSGGGSSKDEFDKRPAVITLKDDLDGEHMMLLPANVYGFDLKEKKWCTCTSPAVIELCMLSINFSQFVCG